MEFWIYTICYIFLGLALLCALGRLLKGPRIFDRLIALDAVGISFVGLMAILSIHWSSEEFIDVILVFSLLNFFTTVIFTSYLDKKYQTNNPEAD